MIKKYLLPLKEWHLRRLKEQKGQSIIIFTFAFLGLLAMLGLALDLGLVYIERIRLSRTADAATLAAVVELPFEEDAIERAIEFIQLNGYDVGRDVAVVVRGCVRSTTDGFGPGNVYEGGDLAADTPFPEANGVVGALYIPATELIEIRSGGGWIMVPRATFMIDTGSHQAEGNACDPANQVFGSANKLQVVGRSYVDMNFMQFFGFDYVPLEDESIAENVTNLDVVVVFDISGSMEFQTACFDCWVRTHPDVDLDPSDPGLPDDYPENGYFSPVPLPHSWQGQPVQQNVAASALCTQYPPLPHDEDGFQYLVHEAEFYSYNSSDWNLNTRTIGQGFWVVQRGARNQDNPYSQANSDNYEDNGWQGNNAGYPNWQTTNVCRPGIEAPSNGGIDCWLGGADSSTYGICEGSATGSVDCSSYVKAHPYAVYQGKSWGSPIYMKFTAGAYNEDCFDGPNLSGACWSSKGLSANNTPPWLEYDFTPTWDTGTTHIWLRAIGSKSDRGYEYAGDFVTFSPPTWQRAIYWQVENVSTGAKTDITENTSSGATSGGRENRAQEDQWTWVKLGSVPTDQLTQYTLRLYMGSAGYKIDRIVFTNDSSGTTPAALLADSDRGPKISPGSATREACNQCNPAYGYTVNAGDCSCQRYNGGPTAGGCTVYLEETNNLENDLYTGIEPIRSAQEAVKNFAKRLDPRFDQLGFIAFESSVQNSSKNRSKLQCLTWAAKSDGGRPGDVRRCYDPSLGTPISYTNVIKAVERQWAIGGTNIAEGMREGLEELGVSGYATDSSCTTNANDKRACDRRGAARRIIVLLTDGVPNQVPSTACSPEGGEPDMWDGSPDPDSDAYECAMYYAFEAAQNNVTVYTIGLGGGADGNLLTAMATGTNPNSGGPEQFYFNARGGKYFNAAKPSDLDRIFSQILENIYVRIVR